MHCIEHTSLATSVIHSYTRLISSLSSYTLLATITGASRAVLVLRPFTRRSAPKVTTHTHTLLSCRHTPSTYPLSDMTHPINTNIFCDRLNQLYLRDQETTNFITTVRTLFGAPFVRRPGHKALQSTQPSSSGSGGGSSTRGRGGGVVVELDQEVNDDIMNDNAAAGIRVLPVPPDNAVLTEITKRLTRYNTALRTCSDKNEDHRNSTNTADVRKGMVMVVD